MTRSDSDRLFTIIFVFVVAIFLLIFKWLKMNGIMNSKINNKMSSRLNAKINGKMNGAKGSPTSGNAVTSLTKDPDELRKERYLIILAAVTVRLIFAGTITGFEFDVNCFKSWSMWAAEDFFGLYSRGSDAFLDYPPGYMYILFFLGKIREIFSIPHASAVYTFIIKTPAIAADIISGIIIYNVSGGGKLTEKGRLFIMSLYLFNPAVFFLSTIWGQIDSILALTVLVASIYLTKGKYELSAAFFAIGVLLKPQGLIFLPVLFFECLRAIIVDLGMIKRALKAAACFTGVFVLAILPFSFGKHPLWIVDLYMGTLEGYSYASMNAYNFYALLGANMMSDSESLLFLKFSTWGNIFIFAFTALTGLIIYQYHKRISRTPEQPVANQPIENVMPVLASALIILGVTTFVHKMHERYFFPALLLLLAVYCINGDGFFAASYVLVTVSGFFNVLFVFSIYYAQNYENLEKSPEIFAISALTVFTTVMTWLFVLRSKGDMGIIKAQKGL